VRPEDIDGASLSELAIYHSSSSQLDKIVYFAAPKVGLGITGLSLPVYGLVGHEGLQTIVAKCLTGAATALLRHGRKGSGHPSVRLAISPVI
jgi:hypothetical protein